MPKRFHLNRPDLAAAVTVALVDCKDVRSHQRLLALRMAASGQFTAAQIAEQNGVSRRQFFHWVNALKAGGVARLLERDHGGGQPAQVHGSTLAELQAGLQTGRWKRAKEIQQWLRQRHATQLRSEGGVLLAGKIGRGLEGAAQDPRKKDADASRRFQQTLCTSSRT